MLLRWKQQQHALSLELYLFNMLHYTYFLVVLMGFQVDGPDRNDFSSMFLRRGAP